MKSVSGKKISCRMSNKVFSVEEDLTNVSRDVLSSIRGSNKVVNNEINRSSAEKCQISRSPFERRPGSAKTSTHFGLQSTMRRSPFGRRCRFAPTSSSHYVGLGHSEHSQKLASLISAQSSHPHPPTQCLPQRQYMLAVIKTMYFYYFKTKPAITTNLVEESENLSGNVSSSGLLVVHDTSRGGEDNVSKLSRGQQVLDPLLDIVNLDVESRRNDSALVEPAVELDHNLAGSVVVHVLKLANVAVLLHHGEKLDDHLGRGSDQDLSLAGLLGVGDGLESVSENGGSGHFCSWW